MEHGQAHGVIAGTISELSGAHATVTDAGGQAWQIPRGHLRDTAAVGDAVTLCVVAGEIQTRQELARALLNELLSGT